MAKLPEPKFNLRVPKSKNPTLISLILRFYGNRLVYSTGHSVHPTDWDSITQRPIIKKQRIDLLKIKRSLDDLAFCCNNIFLEAENGVLTTAKVKELLDLKTGKRKPKKSSTRIKEEKNKKPSFLEFVDIELAEMKSTGMRASSLKTYTHYVNTIKWFAKEVGKFDYEDVDWNLRLEFIDWLASKNYKLSCGNKTLSVLRQFMDRARRKKLHANVDYHGSGWMVPQKKAKGQKVILNNTELQKLAELNLEGYERKVRDLFLIGAGTGQRFSDFSRYQPENFYRTINGVPILSVVSQKTDTPAKVPLNLFPWLIPTLEKYNYASPKVCMQKLNSIIKGLSKQAGITDNIFIVDQYMGRKPRVEKSYVPKYSEVSSHACRRSFATNLYRMGYRLSQIMPMTGHSSESQLREYIGIDAEENAELIAMDIMNQKKTSQGGRNRRIGTR